MKVNEAVAVLNNEDSTVEQFTEAHAVFKAAGLKNLRLQAAEKAGIVVETPVAVEVKPKKGVQKHKNKRTSSESSDEA